MNQLSQRVLLISAPVASRGGVFGWTSCAAQRLEDQGFTVRAIVEARGPSASDLACSWTASPESLVVFTTDGMTAQRLLQLHSVIRKACLDFKPDVVLVSQPAAALATLGQRSHTKTIHIVHSELVRWRRRDRLLRLAFGLTGRRLPFSAVAQTLEPSYPVGRCLDDQAARIADLGLPDATIAPAALEPGSELRALYIGRLEYEKGADRLIWIAACLRKSGVDLHVRGDGSLHVDLVTAGVHCSGWMDDPWEGVRDSDLVIIPSRTEGYPIAMLEAVYRGVPIVAWNDWPLSEFGLPNMCLFDDCESLDAALEAARSTGLRELAAEQARGLRRPDPLGAVEALRREIARTA